VIVLSFQFDPETNEKIYEAVLHGEPHFSSDPWPNISESAKDLVRRMLVMNPKKQITAYEVLCKYDNPIFADSITCRLGNASHFLNCKESRKRSNKIIRALFGSLSEV